MTLDKNIKTFIMHVIFILIIVIYLARKTQIALLIIIKVKILAKYSDFANVSLQKKTLILPKITNLNQYAIKLQKTQQSLYELIYNLDSIELKTLKTYIQINLTNSFIWPSKSPTDAFIFLVKRPNNNFCLNINYYGLNNLTIKN